MKSLWCVAMLVLALVQAAEAFSPKWRWRNDDEDIFRATWKDSVNRAISYHGEGNIRLRKGYNNVSSGSHVMTLRYGSDPYYMSNDLPQWTLVTASDTGMFFLSDSRYLEDGARYSNNILLNNWDTLSGEPAYCGTITIDTSSKYLLAANSNDGYEFEYCLKPNLAKIPASSVYYLLAFTDEMGEYNYYPACVRFPPFYWNYCQENTNHVGQIQFIDEMNGWYFSYIDGISTLSRTKDGGRTWLMLPNQLVEWAFYFVSRDTGWAVINDRLSRSTDGGATWMPRDSVSEGGINQPTAIYFLDAIHGWATCWDGPVVRTSDGGARWAKFGSPSGRLRSLCFVNERVGFTLGDSLYKTTDAGTTWRLVLPGDSLYEKQHDALPRHAVQNSEKKFSRNSFEGGQIQFSDSSEGWVKLDSKLFHTSDGGEHWALLADFQQSGILAFHFSAGGKAWAVGYGGLILATKDGGMTWEHRPSGIGYDLMTIAGVKDKIWIGSDDGTILSSANGGWIAAIDETKSVSFPQEAVLYQNYPNPFNPSTAIRYELPRPAHVTIRIYDMLGREVATLVDEMKAAGMYETVWNASRYSSGIYLYRISAGDFVQTRMMALVK